jgi:hypothetical protein
MTEYLKRQFWKGESTSRTILIVTLRRGITIVHPNCLLRSLWCTIFDGSNVTRSTRGCCISTNVQGICILAGRCLDFQIKLQHSLRQLESRHDCRNNKAFFFHLGVNNHREGDCSKKKRCSSLTTSQIACCYACGYMHTA